MNYFYILQSGVDNGYYYGSTTNLTRRMTQHFRGAVNATKYRLPLRLVYYEAYPDIRQARHREKQVKHSGSVRISLIKRITRVGP